jgi:signal transduction histidine kinase
LQLDGPVPADAALAALPVPAPLARLADEIPLGLVHLGGDGAVLAGNAAATAMLEGSAGADLAVALARLAVRASQPGPDVREALLPSGLGEVRVLLTRVDGGYLAVLGRDATGCLRDQALALRGMLAAAVEGSLDRTDDAIPRAVSAMAAVCPESRLALFAWDGAGGLEALARARGPGPRGPVQLPEPAGEGEDLAARAMSTGHPAHLPRIVRAGSRAGAGAAIAIPVRDQGALVGALWAAGPRLGEGELRLLSGLADAAGALIGRARARAALQAAEARAERARMVAVEREGLATLGHLAACVSHEIASPLACLSTNLGEVRETMGELARLAAAGPDSKRAGALTGELAQVLDDISGDLARVASLVRSVRGLSHRRADESMRFDPRSPVLDAVRIFRGARHAQVSVEAPEALPEVRGSPGLLCQVLLNLLDNAFDAAAAGEIAVRLAGRPEGGAVLEVADRGPGIDPSVRDRVFDAYFTTKPPGQGTGLGLYISRDVVERMGGRISFDTGPAGTTFRVELAPPP